MFQGVGRRKKKRIRNNMDRSEAGRDVRLCSKCHETGHTYKYCTALSYGGRTDGAGPSEAAQNRGRRPNNDGLIWSMTIVICVIRYSIMFDVKLCNIKN